MSWIEEARTEANEADFDPQKLYKELLDAGLEWAEAQAAYELLYETKKVLVARLKQQSSAKSDAQREAEALASPEYIEHITGMNAAAKKANIARVRYESLRTYIDMLRSKLALKRAEMSLV